MKVLPGSISFGLTSTFPSANATPVLSTTIARVAMSVRSFTCPPFATRTEPCGAIREMACATSPNAPTSQVAGRPFTIRTTASSTSRTSGTSGLLTTGRPRSAAEFEGPRGGLIEAASRHALVRVCRTASDQRSVHVDVVEDGLAEIGRCDVLTLIEDDLDAPHFSGGGGQGRGAASRIAAKGGPAR